MVSAAELERDEAPPASGPRRRVLDPGDPGAVPADPAANTVEPGAHVLAEIAGEVCGEVWEVLRALSPLQGAWLTLRIGQLGSALMMTARWRHEGEEPGREALRARWEELVPGHLAMDRLVGLMVDGLCR